MGFYFYNNKMWRSGLLAILLSGGILGQPDLNCQMENVLMKCKNTGNGGHTYFNQGSEWNPAYEMLDWEESNQEDCKPCCKDPNTSINKCPDTDLPDEQGVSYDQLRDLSPRPGRDRRNEDAVMGNSRGPLNRDLHCPRAQSSQKCRRGSGLRIYNRNQNEWNPDDEFTAGRASHWECYPCCRLPGYSIGICPGYPLPPSDDVDDEDFNGEDFNVDDGNVDDGNVDDGSGDDGNGDDGNVDDGSGDDGSGDDGSGDDGNVDDGNGEDFNGDNQQGGQDDENIENENDDMENIDVNDEIVVTGI